MAQANSLCPNAAAPGCVLLQTRLRRPARLRAFTVVELLVAVAILVITVVAVTEIFDLSSETAGRTAAHAEVLGASAAVQQRITGLLSNIEPGLLIIESPAPTGPRADIAGGPAYFRLRHDRLVFIASGAPGEFQSYTDPRCGTPDDPTRAPAASSQALIYVGPGVPLEVPGLWPPASFEDDDYMIPGAEWILAQRSILFVLDPPTENLPGWSNLLVNMDGFADQANGMLYRPPLVEAYQQSKMDIVVSSPTLRADAATFIDLVQRLPLNDLLAANPAARSLWEPNYCPTTVSLATPTATGGRDHYTRSGWNFQPHLADIRIEWTDGRDVLVDPDGNPGSGDEVYKTRWFGLRPDPDSGPSPNSLAYWPVKRQALSDYASPAEAVAFGLDGRASQIEWSNPGGTYNTGGSAANGAYRAVWRTDTWAFRPKALRFTYRIYDSGNRLKEPTDIDLNEDGVADPDPNNPAKPAIVPRFGQEFCIVVALP